jgi:hypothetical protein
LNSVTKKIVQVLFLAVGLIITGHAILTPMLMVIIMITGDFLGMSLTTDNVRPSPMPSAWRVGNLTIAGVFMGLSELVFCTAVLAIGKFRLGLGIDTLRTLAFVVIVFGNQATTYTNRTRQRLWSTRPSFWLVLSSAADLLIASTMANRGNRHGASATLRPLLVMGERLRAQLLFAFMVDIVKVRRFRLTVDTNEHPFIDPDHQLPAHGSESHRRKVMWIVIWILLLLLLVLAVVLVWRHHESREKSQARAAEDHDYDRDGYERATSASTLTPSARSLRSIPIRLPAR